MAAWQHKPRRGDAWKQAWEWHQKNQELKRRSGISADDVHITGM
jgi:hypothetical protein